jgi:hypothetical protein
MYIYLNCYLHFYFYLYFKQKTENGSQTIFLNLFTVCSSCKWKFVVCSFVDEETNKYYLFGNGLNGLNDLQQKEVPYLQMGYIHTVGQACNSVHSVVLMTLPHLRINTHIVPPSCGLFLTCREKNKS